LPISHVPECIEKTKRQLLPCEIEYMKIASYKWKEMHHRRAFWSLKGNVKRKSTYRKTPKKHPPYCLLLIVQYQKICICRYICFELMTVNGLQVILFALFCITRKIQKRKHMK
jgi:hypothetical protein